MGAGKLDQRVSITRVTEIDDGYGGQTTTEVTVGTVWAQVEAVRGQERVIADNLAGTQTYRIKARNSGDWATVGVEDRLVWGGITLNVVSAPNAGRAALRLIEAVSGVVNA